MVPSARKRPSCPNLPDPIPNIHCYPLDVCVVSGKPLDAETASDKLYGVTLVRFCCPRCPAAFEKNPASFVAKVKEARKGKAGAAVGGAKKG